MRLKNSRTKLSFPFAAGIGVIVLLGAAPEKKPSDEKPPDPYAALAYRFIGPPGNRVSAVAGVPGDSNVCYAGGASGGVWKSTDGGIHWKPVFDEQPAQSIGSIAIAPSDPNVVWVGTGEPFIRSNVSLGNGIYKSTDAGKTWKHMGLEKTGRIGRIAIDLRNSDVVFAAALGTCYGPQQERGVFRTTDGGKTWERVPFVDENTGVSDLSMDPNNPRVLFAGAWQIEIKTWGRKSGGPGSGVFVSRRRRDLETDHGARPAGTAARQDRRRRRAERLAARLCLDRDRTTRVALALGRWRGKMEARQPQPASERAS